MSSPGMSQVFAHDKFILVGAVPLFAVNTMTLDESYKIPEVGKGGAMKSQWLGRIGYTITIDGVLVGPERFFYKAALEVMADLSMVLSALSPIPGLGGVPVVSSLTVLPDLQITSLKFTQTSQDQGSVGVSMTLKHCPKGFIAELLGQGFNIASSLAGSTLNMASGVRSVGGPLG